MVLAIANDGITGAHFHSLYTMMKSNPPFHYFFIFSIFIIQKILPYVFFIQTVYDGVTEHRFGNSFSIFLLLVRVFLGGYFRSETVQKCQGLNIKKNRKPNIEHAEAAAKSVKRKVKILNYSCTAELRYLWVKDEFETTFIKKTVPIFKVPIVSQ